MTPRCPGCGVVTVPGAKHLPSCTYHGSEAPPTSVVFSTSAYRKEHGHGPRGTGDWAFSLDGRGPLWIIGVPYSEAKREALRRALREGARTIEVMP